MGPGHTTALLRHEFPLAEITGFDASEAMIARGTRTCADATFAVFDVTRPLLLPADIVYARFLLGHLTDPRRVRHVGEVAAARERGLMVCEEPVRYRSDDPWFARVRESGDRGGRGNGATLGAGTCSTTIRRVAIGSSIACVEHPVPARAAAAMFWRNAVQWHDLDAAVHGR